MNKIKILYLGFFAALVMFSTSCQKDLEVVIVDTEYMKP